MILGIIRILAIVAVLVLIIMSFTLDISEGPPSDSKKPAIVKCEETGGVPITSSWDGRLVNCIYPPK